MNASTTTTPIRSIDSGDFYYEYHGHKVRHLETLLPVLRESSDRLIWLAGDSSLDNKYWFVDKRRCIQPAVGAYQTVLSPPESVPDIAYWMNAKLLEQNTSNTARTSVINTAVEATTLNERTRALRPQDTFLRDHIQPNDILIVSVGGNDVAMAPCVCTICAILGLLCCLPQSCTENGGTCGSCPMDDYCCGCGCSLASCACGFPPCLGYLRHLFGTRTQQYIRRLTSQQVPHKILVCMIYFPDENPHSPSWAGGTLAALGYDHNPGKLQALIRKAFVQATSTIQIPGAQVIPVPLYEVLDGQHSQDYVARVEPSPLGGEKMASLLLHMIDHSNDAATTTSAALLSSKPPDASYMGDR
ncbi:expressed unknown protein [Seminavis robusta]|uniref:Uncharacterized protein n=1 Tax=Seminavis robusta TaxID=568900 RepID=A0A9N8DLB2_9STRA|nr:expressed unknown protein [Seminavis robusta]|eukprot:Sro207_g086910.1 n/a (358) ;mRNA; r:59743-60816